MIKLLIVSAFLYAIALNYASFCWPLLFIFPIPLFIVATKKKLSFKLGFLWGLVFFSMHLHDIAHTIFIMGDGSHFLRLIPSVFIIFYMALYPALWFWCTHKIINELHLKKTFVIVATWTLTLWIYIYCIDHYSLWLFNRVEGYPLVHPLLSLVHKPQLLTLLPIIDKQILTLLLLFIPATIFLWLYSKKTKWFFATLLVCMPWVLSPFFYQKTNPPAWLNTIAYLPVIFPKGTDTHAMINGAMHDIKKIVFYKPQTKIIVLPESAFYCDNFCQQQQALHSWANTTIGKSIHILVGAFRRTKKEYFNCLYWIYDGTLQKYYDKNHAMPLIEQMPKWFNWSWLKKIYFTEHNQITIAHAPRPRFEISADCTTVPYICSELFFNEQPDDQYLQDPILCIANDSWFSYEYVPQLLLNLARLKAIQWQRTIIYCSFYHSATFAPNGQIWRPSYKNADLKAI